MATFLPAMASQPSFLHTPIPNNAPYYLMWNWFYAYILLSSRGIKNMLKIDNNVSPREDVTIYGEAAVRSGKITRQQLAMVKRNEAAHANSVENFTFFVAAVLCASVAGVSSATVNSGAFSYTLARLAYGPLYIFIDRLELSWLRTGAYWWGNFSCLFLLWKAAGMKV